MATLGAVLPTSVPLLSALGHLVWHDTFLPFIRCTTLFMLIRYYNNPEAKTVVP